MFYRMWVNKEELPSMHGICWTTEGVREKVLNQYMRRWTTKWNSMSQSRLPQQSSPTEFNVFCGLTKLYTRILIFFTHCVIFRGVTKRKSHFNPQQLRSEIYHCVVNTKKILREKNNFQSCSIAILMFFKWREKYSRLLPINKAEQHVLLPSNGIK